MTKTQPARPVIALVFIALFLGATPLMLWMGRWKLALVYFLCSIASTATFFWAVAAGLLPMAAFTGLNPGEASLIPTLPIALLALFHAAAIRRTALERPWYARWYVALPGVLVFSFGAALLVRSFLFQPFSTPSASMEPSLMVGDYFFASKTAYLFRDPERGEIAVFRSPSDPAVTMVKRVMGLPGDRVQMIDGVPFINGTPVKSERIELPPAFTQNGTAALNRETLPEGRSYVVADTAAEGPADSTVEFSVPANSYFVLGDNRDNSVDSRYPQTGFIPRDHFIGPFAFRIWNDQGVPLDNRP